MLFPELVSPSLFDSRFDSRQMNILHNRLSKLLSNAAGQEFEFPLLNIHVADDKAIVVVEIPGVDPSEIDLQMINRTLTISAQRKLDEASQERVWYKRERIHGQFSRSIELPFAVDAETVKATCNQGILKIELLRAQVDLPKKINIQSV